MQKQLSNIVLRLVVRHPTLTLEDITLAVAHEPEIGHSVGLMRRAPTGERLAGFYADSLWGRSEELMTQKDPFRSAVELFEKLEANGANFMMLKELKTLTNLWIDIFDVSNVGGVLNLETMSFFQTRNIGLGVELFHNQSQA